MKNIRTIDSKIRQIQQKTRVEVLSRFSLMVLCILVSLPLYASELLGQETGTVGIASEPVEQGWIPKILTETMEGDVGKIALPDFSRAGYAMGNHAIPLHTAPLYNVTDPSFGAIPDDGGDDTLGIQAAIDTAERNGGGVVFLPAGRYEIRKDPSLPILKIRSSHIVLRGAGAGGAGTILHLGSPAPAGNVRRLGTVSADKAARSGALISIRGNENQPLITKITSDCKRGENVISVSDSSSLLAGQVVVISLTDPLIDAASPAPEKVAIAAELTSPYTLIAEQWDTFGSAAQQYTWLVTIAEVIDGHTVRLEKTARFDHLLSYSPKILKFNGVQEVGVEDLHLESSWPGDYQHHKPFKDKTGAVVRSKKEQDYLWNGIWISHAANVWVKNVNFNNLTQGIITSFVGDSTFDNLSFLGQAGHAGVTLGRSNDLLVSRVEFYSPLVHPVTLTMMSSGNVFTNSATHYKGRNEYSGTDTVIDFHGLFPFENLFDNLRGFYVCPGGDLSVLPHGGVRNVFWNIIAPESMSCYTGEDDTEFFRTYATVATSSHTKKTMYEHLPQSFFIGITREGGKTVTIGNESGDKRSKWHVVEGLGKSNIAIRSLYKAQLSKRKTVE